MRSAALTSRSAISSNAGPESPPFGGGSFGTGATLRASPIVLTPSIVAGRDRLVRKTGRRLSELSRLNEVAFPLSLLCDMSPIFPATVSVQFSPRDNGAAGTGNPAHHFVRPLGRIAAGRRCLVRAVGFARAANVAALAGPQVALAARRVVTMLAAERREFGQCGFPAVRYHAHRVVFSDTAHGSLAFVGQSLTPPNSQIVPTSPQ